MTCASVWDIKQVFLWFWWVSNDCFYSEVLLHVVSASCSCSNISHETRYFHVWVGAVQRDDTMTLSYPVRSFLHSHWCEYECIQIINMLVRSMIIVVCSPEYSLVIYLQHSVQVHRSCSAWCWSKVCFSGPFYRVTCLQRLILSVLLHLSSSQHTTCLFRACNCPPDCLESELNAKSYQWVSCTYFPSTVTSSVWWVPETTPTESLFKGPYVFYISSSMYC